MIHKYSELQHSLEFRGSTLSAYFCRAQLAARIEAKEVADEHISFVCPEEIDVVAVKEVALMAADARKEEDAQIEKALRAMIFKRHPSIPEVPDKVFEDACKVEGYDDVEDVQASFPDLDAGVISLLLDRSDFDLHPSGLMIGVGNHFAMQTWDDDELRERAVSISKYLRPNANTSCLSSKNRSELIADITGRYISYAFEATGYHTLENTAGLVKKLSAVELKDVCKKEGISIVDDADNATRVSLVVNIVQYIYSDVIEQPVEIEDGDDGRHAKKARTKSC